MPVASYLASSRRHWPLLVASTALCGAVIGGLPFLAPQQFQAQTTLQVASRDETGSLAGTTAPTTAAVVGPTLPAEPLARQVARRVMTFTQLANSEDMAEGIISAMRLPYSTRDLADRIQATTPFDSTLIEVRVDDRDPAVAAAIANRVAAELVDAGEHSIARPGQPEVMVEVVVPASPPRQPQPVRWFGRVLLGLLAGLALGLLIAVIRDGRAVTSGPAGRHRTG